MLPLALTLMGVVLPITALAQAPDPRVELSVEGLAVWLTRNDVQIPPDTGTRFSLADLIGSGPSPAWRAEGIVHVARRHSLRVVYAPLRIEGEGTPGFPITFAGTTFDPGVRAEATYQFSSYRASYRYRFYDGPRWQWYVGFTGFVRDARVALAQPDRRAEDTDVGFVPLGHVAADARLGARWRLHLELDGTAAPQGRAFDGAALLTWQVTPAVGIGGGYRVIEGGADVEEVYNFAWLNAAVARVALTF
jgi:hypothetical protein